MKKHLKENKRNFFKSLLKTCKEKNIDASTVPTIEYTPKKLQMLKDFSQMTEEELGHIGAFDDEGLFQQLEEINQPPDYIVNALQNNEYSTVQKPEQVSFQQNNQQYSILLKKRD